MIEYRHLSPKGCFLSLMFFPSSLQKCYNFALSLGMLVTYLLTESDSKSCVY